MLNQECGRCGLPCSVVTVNHSTDPEYLDLENVSACCSFAVFPILEGDAHKQLDLFAN